MQRHTLRTAALRLSAFAILLVSFACCVGPTETVEEASEAMSFLPPLNPSTTLTVAPRPTAEELAQATAEVEQFLRDNLPKWKVYVSGRDYYFSARDVQGVKHFFRDPMELDRHCTLVLVPEGGDTRPETWLVLSYQRYWMRGAAYLTDELKLSVFDVLGILLALEDAGGQVPPISSIDQAQGDMFRYEDGPYGTLPVPPPDWIVDNHTWTGGPPSDGVHQPAPKPQPPGNTHPPRSEDWWTWPVTPPPRHTGPSFEDFPGIRPGDKPVGKYPGWDKPHPGEWWQKFRCGGQVWEGYKSDCPDYQPKPIDERWKTPFSDVGKQIVENIHDNVERIRTDPGCLTLCRTVALLPGLLSTACLAGRNVATKVPNVYALAFAVLCEVFKTRLAASAGYLTGALGLEWCKESFCKPPSGTGGK